MITFRYKDPPQTQKIDAIVYILTEANLYNSTDVIF